MTTGDGQTVDGASLLELLSLGVQGGQEITIRAEGPQEREAMDTLCEMVGNQFGLRYDE